MQSNNKRKLELLGMPIGTATSRLRKMLLFDFAKRCNEDICYRCATKIETIEEFSIEHTKSWQYAENPVETFFDLQNISFSHLTCNIKAPRESEKVHGKYQYSMGCRCSICRKDHTKDMKRWRSIRK